MSVFSKLKLSKKAAKEHKNAAAEKGKAETAPKAPYKHIPTHAAHDAISGSPAAWKARDRSKIMEINRQRSEFSRTASMISTGSNMLSVAESSYGASIATSSRPPLSNLPRNSSQNSYRTSWQNTATMDVRPAPPRVPSYQGHLGAYKGSSYGSTTRMRRGHSYHDSVGPSPLSSAMQSAETSPVVSSGTSLNTLSSDHLEMATVTRSYKPHHHQQRSSLSTKVTLPPSSHSSSTERPTRSTRDFSVGTVKPVAPKPTPPPVAAPAVKTKKRFSLLGKKAVATTA